MHQKSLKALFHTPLHLTFTTSRGIVVHVYSTTRNSDLLVPHAYSSAFTVLLWELPCSPTSCVGLLNRKPKENALSCVKTPPTWQIPLLCSRGLYL